MSNQSTVIPVSVKDAVNEIRSGDTIWVGSADSISKAFLDALAQRQNELKDVTILAEKGSYPCKILDELKYKSSFKVLSFFTEALIQTYNNGNKVEFFKFTTTKTIEAVCKQFCVNTIAIAVCSPDEHGNCKVGKSGNYLTPLINNYSGIEKRIAIIDDNLQAAGDNETDTTLSLTMFNSVCIDSINNTGGNCA